MGGVFVVGLPCQTVNNMLAYRWIFGCKAIEVTLAEQWPVSNGGGGGREDDGSNWVPTETSILLEGKRRVMDYYVVGVFF